MKKFSFSIFSVYPNASHPTTEEGDLVRIHDLQTALRLLRCFGNAITKFELTYVKVVRQAPTKIIRYANVFCSESLIDISFHSIFSYAFEWSLKNPFLNVKNVKFVECYMGPKITKFNEWFPAMCSLKLFKNRFDNLELITRKYHNLKHLVMNEVRSHGNRVDDAKNVLTTIRCNTQLRSLTLKKTNTRNILSIASKYLTKLEYLELHDCAIKFFNFFGDAHFKMVKKLKIYNLTYIPFNITMTFDLLDEFLLDVKNLNWTDNFTNFLKKNQKITKLTIHLINDGIEESTLLQIVQTLPMLHELNVFGVVFEVSDILRFLNKFQLFRYGFSVKDASHVDDLKIRLSNKWTINSVDGLDVKIWQKN